MAVMPRRPRSRIARVLLYATTGLLVALVVAFLVERRADIPLETLKARWADDWSRFVDVDGMKVHLKDEGTGQLILLLHGTSSSLHTWDGWAESLRQNYRVLRADLPAFGLTGPSPSRDYSLAAYVRFVDALLDRQGGAPAVIAGNSLGGAIAWEYAVAHPARVRALILVDAGGYPFEGSAPPIAFRIARWPIIPSLLVQMDPRRLVEDGARRSYGDPSRLRPEVLERYIELTLRPGNRPAFLDRMRAPRVDDSARIRDVRAPTLVLWGARDRVIPVEDAFRFARDIPGAGVKIYDDLGHVPMEEDSARTVADVERWLKKIGL
jgi:pimeloyl-ACP methyl ester carboxylesterase